VLALSRLIEAVRACPKRVESLEKQVARNGLRAVRSFPQALRVLLQNLESSEIVSFPTSLTWCRVLAAVFEQGNALTSLSFAAHDLLTYLPRYTRLPESAMPILRERRMIRNLLAKTQPLLCWSDNSYAKTGYYAPIH
jgi:hypothetical protein